MMSLRGPDDEQVDAALADVDAGQMKSPFLFNANLFVFQ
jgi:hypothetical protein